MCSIAGILFKNGKRPNLGMTTGEALTEMMDACRHRGPDSAGWAVYREPREGLLRLRFFISRENGRSEDVERIKKGLTLNGAEIVEDEAIGCTYGVVVRYSGDVQQFSYAMERVGQLVSVGSSLDLIKDVGQPYGLQKAYNIARFNGTHGIGHTRLATETGVHPGNGSSVLGHRIRRCRHRAQRADHELLDHAPQARETGNGVPGPRTIRN